MRGNIERVIDKLLRMKEPTPELAKAQVHVSNLLGFAQWAFTLETDQGIRLLAEEIGFGVDDIRAAFSSVVRKRIQELDPEFN